MALAEVATDAEIAALHARRCDDVECSIGEAVGIIVRRFLRRLAAQARDGLLAMDPAITAALPDVPFDPVPRGRVMAEWDALLDEEVMPQLVAAWRAAYSDRSDTRTGLDQVAPFLAAVRDRLSSSASPSIPEEAFDRIRPVLTAGLSSGRSTREIAEDIGATLSWDPKPNYWRDRLSDVDSRIDAILDPLGPPGTPAREQARLGDPVIADLRSMRNEARARIDEQESSWQRRATTIARTESVGALNAGALAGMEAEGVQCVRWLATPGARTRDTHRRADGQVVRVGAAFDVGGSALRFPGDPRGPAEEVINCRCALVSAECEE